MIIVQIYVDHIIFGATNMSLCKEFESIMQPIIWDDMMGEVTFFLVLQIKQCQKGYFHKSNQIY